MEAELSMKVTCRQVSFKDSLDIGQVGVTSTTFLGSRAETSESNDERWAQVSKVRRDDRDSKLQYHNNIQTSEWDHPAGTEITDHR